MITESQIYWIIQCDHLREVARYLAVGALIVAGLSVFVTVVAVLCILDNNENPMPNVKWACRKLILPAAIVMIFGLLGIAFIPTTKEMALIKVAPALANSELMQTTIPNEAKEIYGLAKAALVEKLKGEKK